MGHRRSPKGKPAPLSFLAKNSLEHELAEAARQGKMGVVQALIEKGADFRSPLCIGYADEQVMRDFLKRGVDPTRALHVCAAYRCEPSDAKLRVLLEAGADPNAALPAGAAGFTAVAIALDRLHADMFMQLVAAGGDAFAAVPAHTIIDPVHELAWADDEDSEGDARLKSILEQFQRGVQGIARQSPVRSLAEQLTMGLTSGERSLAVRLLTWYAEQLPAAAPIDDRVLAVIAAGDVDGLQRMMDAGLSANHRVMPMQEWWTYQRMPIRRKLKVAADAGQPDGSPVLSWAVATDSLRAAKVLLKGGADPEAKDRAGYTAADVARSFADRERFLKLFQTA